MPDAFPIPLTPDAVAAAVALGAPGAPAVVAAAVALGAPGAPVAVAPAVAIALGSVPSGGSGVITATYIVASYLNTNDTFSQAVTPVHLGSGAPIVLPAGTTHLVFSSSSGLNFLQTEPAQAPGSPWLLANVSINTSASQPAMVSLAQHPWPWAFNLEAESGTVITFLALRLV